VELFFVIAMVQNFNYGFTPTAMTKKAGTEDGKGAQNSTTHKNATLEKMAFCNLYETYLYFNLSTKLSV
jgi:hypothetical protein